MCPFYNAQLSEITGAAKGVFSHSQSSCHIAKVVLALTAAKSPQRLTRHLATPPAVSLYGLCQGGVSIGDRSAHLFSFVSFFVRSESPFLRPDLQLACRWRAQKLSRLPAPPPLPDSPRRSQATL